MRLCQISDVDIVANAGPVRCVVVGTENRYVWAAARGYLQDQRYQMSLGTPFFSDLAIRVSARRIEIAQ